MIPRQFTKRRLQVGIGLVLLAGLLIECQRSLSGQPEKEIPTISIKDPVKPAPNAAFASPTPTVIRPEETIEATAARDPLEFLESALDRYDRSVRDYTCTFTKQERVSGKLTTEQVMSAMFREKPYSVRLKWTKNADKCASVLYVADRWIEKGQQMAVVEPAGAIAKMFVSYVMRAIDGDDARKSSRRTIDQFGLRNSLALTVKYSKLAREKGILKLEYKGKGEVDGRETLVFERELPYTDDLGFWPDRVLVVHIDKEWRLPTLCVSYADPGKKTLLGKYMITDVKLNANLADSVFTRESMGL